MYVSAQTIITAGAVLSALVAFITLAWKLFKWINHQKEQDQELIRIEQKFDDKVKALKDMHNKDQENIQEEQTLVVYGLLACLKGLAAQGCNGPVSEAIDRIEKHINKKAHGQE
ncbi:MAG: branched-chain amino acid ABC transporter permease [Clostridia bacterium]|nr:branched-chain amino acid ABC transporter permease [Clostridia bacterium]